MDDMGRTLAIKLNKIEWEAALRTIPRLVRVDKALLDEAIALHLEGDYQTAQELLDTAEHCESDPVALNTRGLARLGLRDFEGALADFDAAIEILKTQWSRAAANRAATLVQMDRYEEALRAARKACRLQPHWAVPWVNRFVIHCRRRDLDAAFRDAEVMQRAWPTWQTDADLGRYLREDIDLRLLREDPRCAVTFGVLLHACEAGKEGERR